MQNDLLLLAETFEDLVFTPFEMPSFTLSFFLPLSALASGISTEPFRSLS